MTVEEAAAAYILQFGERQLYMEDLVPGEGAFLDMLMELTGGVHITRGTMCGAMRAAISESRA